MIASEKGGRGAEKHRGRSAFLDQQVDSAMWRLLELGGVRPASRRVTVDGVPLHYLELGAGPTVVLLHGAGGGAANWYRIMRPLAARYHIISIDLPGFGLSGSITPIRPLGVQVASLMARLLGQIAVRPDHIVGTSFGGLVAARMAQRIPVSSVTLIDAAGMWPEASLGLRLVCNRLLQRIPLKQSRRGVQWLFRNVLISTRLEPEHEAALVEYIYTSAVRTDQRLMAQAYALFAGLRGQTEVLAAGELQALAARVLVLWGEQDRFLPAPVARRAAALAAGVQLRIIPGAGHSPNWEAPDAVLKEILSFLP
jgi:pimeloyl-ACP methyl ester carboxylesterase